MKLATRCLALSLVLAVPFVLAACAPSRSAAGGAAGLSPTQHAAMQTKELSGSFDNAFKATISVLQDHGWQIDEVERDSGLIQATSAHYQDVIGPLGRPTHIEKIGRVVCVGGGTGVAVLHPITRALKDAGNHVICIIGARSKELLILEDHMRDASHDLRICTDDGSYGRKGFVTEELKDILDSESIQQVVAIGPVPMMKFVSKITKEYDVPTLVSLNPIMAQNGE